MIKSVIINILVMVFLEYGNSIQNLQHYTSFFFAHFIKDFIKRTIQMAVFQFRIKKIVCFGSLTFNCSMNVKISEL